MPFCILYNAVFENHSAQNWRVRSIDSLRFSLIPMRRRKKHKQNNKLGILLNIKESQLIGFVVYMFP